MSCVHQLPTSLFVQLNNQGCTGIPPSHPQRDCNNTPGMGWFTGRVGNRGGAVEELSMGQARQGSAWCALGWGWGPSARRCSQKRRWCARELGPHVEVRTCLAQQKCHHSCKGAVLIDDRLSLRSAWQAGAPPSLFRPAIFQMPTCKPSHTPHLEGSDYATPVPQTRGTGGSFVSFVCWIPILR